VSDTLIQIHDRVLHLTLNRPDKRNALTREMCETIVEAAASAESRRDLGCTLISANGGVFCSGMDLGQDAGSNEVLQVHERLFTLGATSLKPIVIAVNGAALAGGLGLVAQGHVVLASTNAVFSLPEIRIGLWPFVIYRSIEAALGNRRTLQLSLTGNSFHTQEALDWGLVHQICPSNELNETAKGVARELAKASPLAIAAGMRYVREAAGKSADEAGVLAATIRRTLTESGDYKEGVAAFKEKREPRWPSIPIEHYANLPRSGDPS
jgi:enoyl-CoA hydratase/carnithine racemase